MSSMARRMRLFGVPVLMAMPAVEQQVAGSRVHATLDAGGDTVPGVGYVTIVSRYDEVITPYTNQYLRPGPGATVRNITLQDVCRLDFAEHIAMTHDPITMRLVRNALDPARQVSPQCRYVPPFVSGDAERSLLT
jgi:hypothetical protein